MKCDLSKIDTLVFDYGGVIVDIDDEGVAEKLCCLADSSSKEEHMKKLQPLLRQFIDGIVPTDITLANILSLCRKDVTMEQILELLNETCDKVPISRLEALVQLRKKYKVYLLSNICDVLWESSEKVLNAAGYSSGACFDRLFLSYEMGTAKPDAAIYQKMIDEAGLNPETTLYFDDREDNCKMGSAFGLNAVPVKTNYVEQTSEWKELMKQN